MNNKQRREIIENAKASGYDGSYVDLFRDSAAPLKLAVTEEERMKGLKPYNQPGGQAMSLPNNPPNNPVNTIGARPPIRAKSVGSKVGSTPVAPGISSFKGVVTAGDLRARGKYGRRRAEEGTQRPPESTANPALFNPNSSPKTIDDYYAKELDKVQIALGAGSVAAGVTGVGEVVSAPMDVFNAGLSARRALGYAAKGKWGKAAEYMTLGGANLVAALPFVGNLAAGATTAKLASNLENTARGAQVLQAGRNAAHAIEHGAHIMHAGGEAAITGYKGLKYGYKALKEEEDANNQQFAQNTLPGTDLVRQMALNPKLKRGGYTDKFGRIKRSVGGPSDPLEGYTNIPGEEEGTMANTWDAVRAGGLAMRDFFTGKTRGTIEKARKEARNDTMNYAVANYLTEMQDPQTGQFRTESDPRAAVYINRMFADVGQPDLNSVDAPWSAATVSHFAKQIDPSFKGSALHADYINDAFQKNKEGKKTSGNYKARKINWKDDYEVGDILFRGREATRGWSYKDFKNASKKDQGYTSHSDIIVGVGEDDRGKYYEILGGNMGGQKDAKGNSIDGTQHSKIQRKYVDQIKATYAGAMTTNKKKIREERKEARKVLQETKRAKKKKAPRNAPKPNEPDLNLDTIEMEEENIPVFEWDKGNRRKRGGRLRDRRRKARKKRK